MLTLTITLTLTLTLILTLTLLLTITSPCYNAFPMPAGNTWYIKCDGTRQCSARQFGPKVRPDMNFHKQSVSRKAPLYLTVLAFIEMTGIYRCAYILSHVIALYTRKCIGLHTVGCMHSTQLGCMVIGLGLGISELTYYPV